MIPLVLARWRVRPVRSLYVQMFSSQNVWVRWYPFLAEELHRFITIQCDALIHFFESVYLFLSYNLFNGAQTISIIGMTINLSQLYIYIYIWLYSKSRLKSPQWILASLPRFHPIFHCESKTSIRMPILLSDSHSSITNPIEIAQNSHVLQKSLVTGYLNLQNVHLKFRSSSNLLSLDHLSSP